MKKNTLLTVICVLLFTSCVVKKDYVNNIIKEGDITNPQEKIVLVTGFENIRVNNFTKTFEKNFSTDSLFVDAYINEFITEAKKNNIYSDYLVDVSSNWEELNKGINADRFVLNDLFTNSNADYMISFSNFEITNRVETSYAPAVGPNGGAGTHTSIEYCIINVEVIIYDTKTQRKILEFVTTGESSVFLFNFTKTFLRAKTRSIKHIINYLKNGQVTYTKY